MQPAAKAQSGAENTEPQSLLKRYIEAQNAGDLDSALALWAEDGVIINTRGREDGRSVGEIIWGEELSELAQCLRHKMFSSRTSPAVSLSSSPRHRRRAWSVPAGQRSDKPGLPTERKWVSPWLWLYLSGCLSHSGGFVGFLRKVAHTPNLAFERTPASVASTNRRSLSVAQLVRLGVTHT